MDLNKIISSCTSLLYFIALIQVVFCITTQIAQVAHPILISMAGHNLGSNIEIQPLLHTFEIRNSIDSEHCNSWKFCSPYICDVHHTYVMFTIHMRCSPYICDVHHTYVMFTIHICDVHHTYVMFTIYIFIRCSSHYFLDWLVTFPVLISTCVCSNDWQHWLQTLHWDMQACTLSQEVSTLSSLGLCMTQMDCNNSTENISGFDLSSAFVCSCTCNLVQYDRKCRRLH